MLSPIITMFKHFPLRAWSTVLMLVLISWYAYRQIRCRYEAGSLSRRQGMSRCLLVNYLLLLLFLTVLGRRSLDYDRYNLEALYSYRDVLTMGDPDMALQIVTNIAAFVPVGLLGSLAVKNQRFLKALLLGIGLSVCIELSQLALRCGMVEIDDLISNLLGTLIGCIIALLCRLIQRRLSRSPK